MCVWLLKKTVVVTTCLADKRLLFSLRVPNDEQIYKIFVAVYAIAGDWFCSFSIEQRVACTNTIFKYEDYYLLFMKRNTDFSKLKQKIVGILKSYGIKKAGIFGSYARGEQKRGSDVDILVKVPKKVSFYDFVGIKLDLEDNLGKKVDLVEYCTIKERIKKRILGEEIRII